jgi:hypothetical protein
MCVKSVTVTDLVPNSRATDNIFLAALSPIPNSASIHGNRQ